MEQLNDIENKIIDFSEGVEKIMDDLTSCFDDNEINNDEAFNAEVNMRNLIEELKNIKDKLHTQIEVVYKDNNFDYALSMYNEHEEQKKNLERKKEFLGISKIVIDK